MLFEPIDAPKVADAVVSEIERLIVHGVLRPGEKLPPERDLAASMNVSRGSLREALDALEARGVLTKKRGSGVVVSDQVAASLSDPLCALLASEPQALTDFIAFRRLIETDATERAARHATAADRRRLSAVVAQLDAAHDSQDAAREATLDLEFHMVLVEAAGNLVTTQVMRALAAALSDGMRETRAQLYDRPAFRDAILTQHRAIADAVLGGDAPTARKAASTHLDYVAAELAERRVAEARAAIALRRPIR